MIQLVVCQFLLRTLFEVSCQQSQINIRLSGKGVQDLSNPRQDPALMFFQLVGEQIEVALLETLPVFTGVGNIEVFEQVYHDRMIGAGMPSTGAET